MTRAELAGIALLLCASIVLTSPESAASAPITEVVARARSAVVSITTRALTAEDFAGGPTTPGLGSGVIITADGLIVTNFHVVKGTVGRIKVTLSDDRRFDATLVGADPASDLALLRIKAAKLPSLRLGDSDRLAIGQPVIAIGNALWIEGGPSVTAGIVSALNRSMEQPGLPYLHHLIQTDAAINPGNSGGPLLNLRGEVVGINSAVILSAHGIGFAIAINGVKPIIAELLAKGRIVRPWLGLEAVSVTSSIAYANELTTERGVLIVAVAPDGPADREGIVRGDVIIGLGGQPVRDLHGFENVLNRQRIGTLVPVVVQRGVRRFDVQLGVLERPAVAERAERTP